MENERNAPDYPAKLFHQIKEVTGMSQAAIARELNMNQATICRIIGGRSNPSKRTLLAAEELLSKYLSKTAVSKAAKKQGRVYDEKPMPAEMIAQLLIYHNVPFFTKDGHIYADTMCSGMELFEETEDLTGCTLGQVRNWLGY